MYLSIILLQILGQLSVASNVMQIVKEQPWTDFR
jgi:hypothetical protein